MTSKLLLRRLNARVSYFSTSETHPSSLAGASSDAERSAALPGVCPLKTSTASLIKPRPFEEIPGPRALPIIGTQWLYYPGGPLHGIPFREKFWRLREMYGDIIRENIVPGFLTVLHVFNPEDIETIFRNDGKYPIRQAFLMMKRYNEKYNNNVCGVISSQGEDWYEVRSQVQKKITHPTFVRSHVNVQQTVADDLVTWIRKYRNDDDVVDDILPQLYRYSTEAIGLVCFNRRVGVLDDACAVDSDAHTFIMAVNDVMAATHEEFGSWFLFLYFDTPLFRKFKKAQDSIKRIALKFARELLKEKPEGPAGDEKLIPYLLKETSLSEQQVLTFITELFFGGVDTTSHFLGFTLYSLCKHPAVMDRLKTEIDDVLPDKSRVLSESLDKMPYLRAVIKESLRYLPVTGGNGRTSTRDLVLSGYRVPAGTFFGIHTDLTSQCEEFVQDAQRFRPERWLRNDVKMRLRPFTYLPFGFGKRRCLGKLFAEQEVSLALIKILQNFEIEYEHEEEMRYDFRTINTPLTPLKFRFSDVK